MSTFIKVQKPLSQWKVEIVLIKLFHRLMRWSERHQQRKQLARMSDHMLKDIGISRRDAWQEAQKPFWKK